ncbi:MAG TPA: DNA polymerase III subunit gamma/tau [Ruminococcaceae bacterium]|nr:DNA polymerase III subunit gamma/tau [Oscillospiraceae bacterium]
MYQVLYRKWRPQTFDDVSGQEHITTTLKNEIQSGRLNHAYLFTGSRGTGKTTCAKILAKTANCLNPQNGNPCGECEICRGIDSGSIMDIVEMDAASNRKIDDIRDIIDEVQFKPSKCRYRVYIVDEVHMLTTEAFNALLKTLEEPPEHVIFILATTEVHKLPQTILSRCQRFDFHRIPPSAIAERLQYVANREKAELSGNAAMLIAGIADGALRDALSLLDRCMSDSMVIDEEVVRNAAGLARKDYIYDLASCVINKGVARALEKIDELYSESKDMSRLCDELISHFRALMLIKSVRNPRSILVMSDDEFEQAQTQSDYLSLADIVYYMDVLSRAYTRMGHGTGDRIELEMAMAKLCSPELDVTNEAVAARITALEKAVKRGITVQRTEPLPETETKENTRELPLEKEPEAEKPAVKPKEQPKAGKEPKQSVKPAPEPEKQARVQQNVNVEEIYRNAKPFPGWVEIVENLKPVSRTIAAAFTGSSAYESGNYLLIDTTNELAFDLLRHGSQRSKIREIITETTGRIYRLGPYRRPEKKQEQTDPMQQFKAQLKDSGVTVIEE